MKREDNMPSWVFWGLWGISSRRVAMYMAIVLGMLALAPIAVMVYLVSLSVQLTLLNWFVFVGCFVFEIAMLFWSWSAIKWVDNNSRWGA